MRFGVRGASRSSALASSTGMMTASSLVASSFSFVGGVCSMLLRSGSDSSPCVRRRMQFYSFAAAGKSWLEPPRRRRFASVRSEFYVSL